MILKLILITGLTFYFGAVGAQKKVSKTAQEKRVSLQDHLFETDDILHFKLVGRLNKLFNDRYKNIAYHPLLLQYKINDTISSVKLTVKTRGNFRRRKENCKMPPLMLNFPKTEKLKGSAFENQNKLKLVVPCFGDEYVIREWLVCLYYQLAGKKHFIK